MTTQRPMRPGVTTVNLRCPLCAGNLLASFGYRDDDQGSTHAELVQLTRSCNCAIGPKDVESLLANGRKDEPSRFQRAWITRRTATTPETRFWSKVEITKTCWNWVGSRHKSGYGDFCGIFAGRAVRCVVHRLAWELMRGPIPIGMIICHRCDNRSCVNPEHLFLGTHWDNTHDCIAKGRFKHDMSHIRKVYGEDKPGAKLTEAKVVRIRQLREDGCSWPRIANEMHVSPALCRAVVARQCWKHVQ